MHFARGRCYAGGIQFEVCRQLMTQSWMTRGSVEIAHREGFFSAAKTRILQVLACHSPGATTWRVWLHRWRGVHIGKDVWIGYDAIIETSWPELVTIRDRATIQIRATIIAHFRRAKRRPHRGRCDARPGCDYLTKCYDWEGAIVAAGS